MEKVFEVIGEYHKYKINISILMSLTEPFFTIYSLIYPFFTKIPNFKCFSKNNNNDEYFYCDYNKELCNQNNISFIKDEETSLINLTYTFDLFCDKKKYSPMIRTSYFLGALLGFLFFGYLPDKYVEKQFFWKNFGNYKYNVSFFWFIIYFIFINSYKLIFNIRH